MLYVKLMGGLGNQLFIYAFARSYQLKYREDVVFLVQNGDPSRLDFCKLDRFDVVKEGVSYREDPQRFPAPVPYFLFRMFRKGIGLCSRGDPVKQYSLEEKLQPLMNALGLCQMNGSAYVPIRRPLFGASLIASGYFQSEEYFRPYADTIRKELRITEPLSAENAPVLRDILSSDSVCIHIRRGDYLLDQFSAFRVCTEAYYRNAAEKMLSLRPDARFFVFSDDIGWVKEHWRFPNATYVDRSNGATQDLRLMSACNHFILSNSSFSWWAQYLADRPEKIVIAPDRWYNDGRKADIYLPAWVRLPV